MSLYGQPRTEFEEITTEDTDISIDISVEGSNEKVVERVAMFARDQAVRAVQAHEDRVPPEECVGTGIRIRWADIFDDEDGVEDTEDDVEGGA